MDKVQKSIISGLRFTGSRLTTEVVMGFSLLEEHSPEPQIGFCAGSIIEPQSPAGLRASGFQRNSCMDDRETTNADINHTI